MPDTYSKISFWKRLGSGSYNVVYKHQKEALVLKTQKQNVDANQALDNPIRSIRLWNEINPDLEPKAFLCGYTDENHEYQVGWVAPFIEGRQSTDEEIAKKLLEIYQRTGRILADACSPKNFITTPKGQVICVDIGLALQLEKREVENRSFTSLAAWQDTAEGFKEYFKKIGITYPKTLRIIKGLLFLKDNAPDFDLTHVQPEDHRWANWANKYRLQSQNEPSWEAKQEEAYERDKQLMVKLVFENTKSFMVKRLSQYIASRGSINHQGVFKASLLTLVFRDTKFTEEKVAYARKLIERIENVSNYEALEKVLNTHHEPENRKFFTSKPHFESDLERAVKTCEFELAIIKKRRDLLEPEGSPKPPQIDPSF